MVMVWWQGMQCETHREDLCGGEQGTKKNTLFEKTRNRSTLRHTLGYSAFRNQNFLDRLSDLSILLRS